jgi:Spy/CpxP family protein refolding chaperone
MIRRTLLTAGALALAAVAAYAAGGIPRAGKQNETGPLGFPVLKKLAEQLQLTHDQEQAILRVYNEFKKKEHELQQENSRKDTSGNKPSKTDTASLRADMIKEIKALITAEQQKKLDEILSEKKKK